MELCSGDNAEILNDYLKQSKLKIEGFGVFPNSKEVITVVLSSFMGSLGDWAAYRARAIVNARLHRRIDHLRSRQNF
jgi:hypothetical protein